MAVAAIPFFGLSTWKQAFRIFFFPPVANLDSYTVPVAFLPALRTSLNVDGPPWAQTGVVWRGSWEKTIRRRLIKLKGKDYGLFKPAGASPGADPFVRRIRIVEVINEQWRGVCNDD